MDDSELGLPALQGGGEVSYVSGISLRSSNEDHSSDSESFQESDQDTGPLARLASRTPSRAARRPSRGGLSSASASATDRPARSRTKLLSRKLPPAHPKQQEPDDPFANFMAQLPSETESEGDIALPESAPEPVRLAPEPQFQSQLSSVNDSTTSSADAPRSSPAAAQDVRSQVHDLERFDEMLGQNGDFSSLLNPNLMELPPDMSNSLAAIFPATTGDNQGVVPPIHDPSAPTSILDHKELGLPPIDTFQNPDADSDWPNMVIPNPREESPAEQEDNDPTPTELPAVQEEQSKPSAPTSESGTQSTPRLSKEPFTVKKPSVIRGTTPILDMGHKSFVSSPLADRQPLGPAANAGNIDTTPVAPRADEMKSYALSTIQRYDSQLSARKRKTIAHTGTPYRLSGQRVVVRTPVSVPSKGQSFSDRSHSSFSHPPARQDRLGRMNITGAGRTPAPRRSRLAFTSGNAGNTSDVSSNDLLTIAFGGLEANVSYPDARVGEMIVPGGTTVDDDRLHELLSKTNRRLELENEELHAQLVRAQEERDMVLRDAERGQYKQVDEISGVGPLPQQVPLPPSPSPGQEEMDRLQDRVRELEHQLSLAPNGTFLRDMTSDASAPTLGATSMGTFTALQDEVDDLRTKLHKVELERDLLSNQLSDNSRIHNETIEALRRGVEQQMTQRTDELNEAQQQLHKLQTDAEQFYAQLADAQRQASIAASEAQAARQAREGAQHELQVGLENAAQDASQRTAALLEKEAQFARVQEELIHVQNQLVRVEEEREILRDRVDAQLDGSDQVTRLQGDLMRYRDRVSSLEDELAELKKSNLRQEDQWCSERQSLQTDLSDSRAKLSESEAQRISSSVALDKVKAENKVLAQEAAELGSLRQFLSQWQAKVDELNYSKELTEQAQADMALQLAQQTSRANMAYDELNRLNTQVSELQSQLDQALVEASRLRTQMTQLESQEQSGNETILAHQTAVVTLPNESVARSDPSQPPSRSSGSQEKVGEATEPTVSLAPVGPRFEMARAERENKLLRDEVADLHEQARRLRQQTRLAETSAAVFESFVQHNDTTHRDLTLGGAITPARSMRSFHTMRSMRTQRSLSGVGNDTSLSYGQLVEHLHAIQAELDVQQVENDRKIDLLHAQRRQYAQMESDLDALRAERDTLVARACKLFIPDGPGAMHLRQALARSGLRLTQVDRLRETLAMLAQGLEQTSTLPTAAGDKSLMHRSVLSAPAGSGASFSIAAGPGPMSLTAGVEEALAHLMAAWEEQGAQLRSSSSLPKGSGDSVVTSALKAELADAQAATHEVIRDLHQDRPRVAALAAELASAGKDREGLRSSCVKAEQGLVQLSKQLTAQTDELKRVYSALSQAKDQAVRADLAAEADDARAKSDSIRREKDKAARDRDDLLAQYQNAEDRHNDLASALEASRSNARALSEQLATSAEQIATLSSSLRAKDEEIAMLAGKQDRLKASRAGVLAQIEALQTDLERAMARNIVHDHTVTMMQTERAQKREEVERATNALHEAEARIEASEAAADEAALTAATAKAQSLAVSDELVARAEQHRRELQTLIAQCKYLKARIVRETDRRMDAAYAKAYVSRRVAQLEAMDAITQQALEGMGIALPPRPDPSAPTAKGKFVAVVNAVRAAIRMRKMAANWAYTRQFGVAMCEAFEASKARGQTCPRIVHSS